MAEQLLKFIKSNKNKLTDNEHIVFKNFVEKYPNQNGGILDSDIIKWIKMMNPNVKFKYITHQNSIFNINFNKIDGFIIHSINHYHTYVTYYHDGIFENYDTGFFQHTINNCSLYAGLIIILRPLLKSINQMINILKLLEDTKNSTTVLKLAEISKFYFARDIKYFKYRN